MYVGLRATVPLIHGVFHSKLICAKVMHDGPSSITCMEIYCKQSSQFVASRPTIQKLKGLFVIMFELPLLFVSLYDTKMS